MAARSIYDVLSPIDNQDSEDDDTGGSPKEPSQETLPTTTHHSLECQYHIAMFDPSRNVFQKWTRINKQTHT
jgi:hypothetical protein